MRFFVCATRLDGGPISSAALAHYAAAPCWDGATPQWSDVGGLSIAIRSDDVALGAIVAQSPSLVGVGVVRLDNRDELLRRLRLPENRYSDLSLVLRALALGWSNTPRELIGEFGFVVRDTHSGQVRLVRDALGMVPLYYVDDRDLIVCASRAEVLAVSGAYDTGYLASLIAKAPRPDGATAYAGVRSTCPGTIHTFDAHNTDACRYWTLAEWEPKELSTRDPASYSTELLSLFERAVQLRLAPDASHTWSMLSGGLDSSSVVSVAERLASVRQSGGTLGGTVSVVHTNTSADEREFSNSVVAKWHLRNELICDCGFLDEDDGSYPLTDQPTLTYGFYAQDRRMAERIRHFGGRLLLTGYGGDHLFAGSMLFFADWIATGRLSHAVRDMVRRAAIGHASFWQLAFRNAVLPLLPTMVRARLLPEHRVPQWVDRRVIRRFALNANVLGNRAYSGRIGHKYWDYIAGDLSALPGSLAEFDLLDQSLDVRHPFFYRPLVEFALTLPPSLCVQPHARKWVLREAMRGILPELVRTRVGKATTNAVMAKAVLNHRDRFVRATRHSILADLGIVDPVRWRAAIEAADSGSAEQNTDLAAAMAVELWLQVRSGQQRSREVPARLRVARCHEPCNTNPL